MADNIQEVRSEALKLKAAMKVLDRFPQLVQDYIGLAEVAPSTFSKGAAYDSSFTTKLANGQEFRRVIMTRVIDAILARTA